MQMGGSNLGECDDHFIYYYCSPIINHCTDKRKQFKQLVTLTILKDLILMSCLYYLLSALVAVPGGEYAALSGGSSCGTV
jgi:hypothetical protein